MQKFRMSPNVLLAVWSILVSATWLLPNHVPPWASFHGDAWMAVVGLLGAFATLRMGKTGPSWHSLPTLVLVLVCIPWIQYFTGTVPFVSQAWMSSSYLYGLLLALLFAARWEREFPLQLMDALFGAIAIAAILSVGLALSFWLEVMEATMDNLWTMGYYGGRHYANVGQPNLLATLLLWGVFSIFWAYIRRTIGPMVAIGSIVFLILGLALTKSRMAYLAGFVALLAIWFYRDIWSNRRLPWTATAATVFLLLAPYLLSSIDSYVNMDAQSDSYIRAVQKDELRLRAWNLFSYAALIKPWFGYGWKEVVQAQMEVARSFPSLGGMFGHSHNIVLDLILWTGIPLGIGVVAYLGYWFWSTAKRISTQEEVVIYLTLLVLGVHSMLEYPHQYLYFLVPAGMFMGVLNTRVRTDIVFSSAKWVYVLMWMTGVLISGLLIRDYFNIQTSFTILRFQRAGLPYIETNAPKIPEVRLLTQFREWFEMVERPLSTEMSESELAQQEKVTRAYPSPGALYQLALSYAKNGQPQKAQNWLALICKLSDESECASIQRAWKRGSQSDPKMALVVWPSQ